MLLHVRFDEHSSLDLGRASCAAFFYSAANLRTTGPRRDMALTQSLIRS